jgi:hypothetical protein
METIEMKNLAQTLAQEMATKTLIDHIRGKTLVPFFFGNPFSY